MNYFLKKIFNNFKFPLSNRGGVIDKGSIFVVVILMLLVFGGFIFAGGTIPIILPDINSEFVNIINPINEDAKDSLQLQTFNGATITPNPTYTPVSLPSTYDPVYVDCGRQISGQNKPQMIWAIRYNASPASDNEESIKIFYSGRDALLLGAGNVSQMRNSPSDRVNNPLLGDQNIRDQNGFVLYPALFITDITAQYDNRSGDSQEGGQANAPDIIYGTWKSRGVVNPTRNYQNISPSQDPLFPINGPPGVRDTDFSSEIIWKVNDLQAFNPETGGFFPITRGNVYRIQAVLHSGGNPEELANYCFEWSVGERQVASEIPTGSQALAGANCIGLCSEGSTNGFGSGNVYSVSPGSSICNSAKQLRPGDTLYIRGGVYNETIDSSCFTSEGTENNLIYLSGYPGETAVLDSNNTKNQAIALNSGSFITFRNLEVRDYSRAVIQLSEGTRNIAFENMYVHDIGKGGDNSYSTGFEFSGGIGHIVRNSRLDNIGTTNLHHGIYLAYNNRQTSIYNNYITNMAGAGVHAWHDTAAVGTRVYNNIITGSALEGAIVFGDGSHDIEIYNNTLSNNYRGIRLFDYGQNGRFAAYNITIRNNIMRNSDMQIMAGVTGVTQSNNYTQDPLFEGATDYRLAQNSPAVDAGESIPWIQTDIAGKQRISGSGIDIGAYESW